ncbi:uncharacterized protein LOC129582827 [Paramacrobiotus metropolitanus]|uniref:uncharacterized protein LOC129582827 n=1 Tax=Paramacrobiotus metropolitanus TaxID=2943436 RepID=UPI002445E958|nr:uncharacterized protein LOC129582827 [Paramacrobiotus metropolitanus]
MLVYGNDYAAVYAWNAVDVLVDGMLQHGRVINVVDKGLIVDFGCRTQRTQFIEYGRIFLTIQPASCMETHPGDNVQVLMRASPDVPWKWFAGRRVPTDCSFDSCYIVKVQLPHGVVQELLPWQQMRRPPSDTELASHRVRAKEFEIRSCPLPAVWSDASPALQSTCRWHLQRVRLVWCTKVLRSTLLYVQHPQNDPLQPQELEAVYKDALKDHAESNILLGRVTIQPAKTKRMDSVSDEIRLSVPSELLVEIFLSLNSICRVRCRRICALWDHLLTTEAYFPDVRVSCRPEESPSSWMKHQFWMLSTLLHCVNRRTKMVILTQVDIDEGCAAVSIISHMIDRIGTLVFYQCCWPHWDFAVNKFLACHGSIMRMCNVAERAVLFRCSLVESCLTGVLSCVSGKPGPQLEMQLWDLLEQNLVATEPFDRTVLAEWIAYCAQHGLFLKLESALYNYQSADPRPSNNYRDFFWSASAISGLDVNTLTPLAAAGLHRVMKNIQWLPQSQPHRTSCAKKE